MIAGKSHTERIDTTSLIERDSRFYGVRRFFHRVFPSIVAPPEKGSFIRFSDGTEKRIFVIASAEGVRYGGSTLPLPGCGVICDESNDAGKDWRDPLAVDLTPDAGDIPSDGWPAEFKPDVAERILRDLPADYD